MKNNFYKSITFLILSLAMIQVCSLNSQTPISFGESIGGTINPSSTILNYSISLTEGDIVFIRVSPVSGSPVSPRIELYATVPQFMLLKAVQTTAVVRGVDLVFTIPVGGSGQHTILVSDVGQNSTGGICISVERFNSSPAASFLDCNSSLTSSISCNSTIKSFKYSVAANTPVQVSMAPVSGSAINPQLWVCKSDGTIIGYDSTTAVVVGISVLIPPQPSADCYYVYAGDLFGNDSGGFSVSQATIGGSCDTTCSSAPPIFEICNNGIDDDGNNLTDCLDPYCGTPSIQTVTTVNPSCPLLNNGSVSIVASMGGGVGGQLLYSINGGTAYQQAPLFPGLTPGIYSVSVSNSASGCTDNYTNNPVELIGPICPEICNNGQDDDGNGLADCLDPYCGTPSIQTVTIVNPSCPLLNNGSVGIAASMGGSVGGQLLYSINGGTAYQQSPLFPGLTPGIYSVRVSNSASGCTANYANNPVELIGPTCSEICDNNIDDDGDGFIDCEDFDCGPAGLEWYNAPSTVCPNSPFVLTLTSADASFDYELYKDNGANPVQTKSGTGDTLLFEVPSINNTTTFKVVAVNKTDPGCEFDFSTQGKDVMVGIGDLVMLIDTVAESAFNEDGSINICLPNGVSPFILEYMPDNRGQANPAQGPVNCVGYFEITALKAGFYKVKVTDANGCSNEQVVLVDNPEKRRIGFPPAILLTPNGDGYNDYLVYDGLYANPNKSELIVLNRYGSVVYEANPYGNDWDATYNGNPVPADTYFYYLRVFEQEEIVYEGYITIAR